MINQEIPEPRQPDIKTGFHPVGPPDVVYANPWFGLEKQDMDFVDPKTGIVRKSAADGGQMNYVRMMPGVTIVADVAGEGTILLPQERYATNLVYGKPVRHYELPAGGIEAHDGDNGVEIDQESVLRAAQREFGEEAGYEADDYLILGLLRGAMSQPGVMTHHNITVLAKGVRAKADGPLHETTEILGSREVIGWNDAHEMYLNPDGLWTPEGSKLISSAATINSLNLAHRYLERQEQLGSKIIDLKRNS